MIKRKGNKTFSIEAKIILCILESLKNITMANHTMIQILGKDMHLGLVRT